MLFRGMPETFLRKGEQCNTDPPHMLSSARLCCHLVLLFIIMPTLTANVHNNSLASVYLYKKNTSHQPYLILFRHNIFSEITIKFYKYQRLAFKVPCIFKNSIAETSKVWFFFSYIKSWICETNFSFTDVTVL